MDIKITRKMSLKSYTTATAAKAAVFLLLGLLFAAGVYDFRQEEAGTAGVTLKAKKTAGVSYRINGRRVKAHKYTSDMDQGDVIGWYLAECGEKGLEADESPAVRAMAAPFVDAGKNPAFDYVYYTDTDGTGRLVAAANRSKGCGIVELEINPKAEPGAENGFDDGISHYPAAERKLSMEIMDGAVPVNFSNFYMCAECALSDAADYYEKNLPNSGWQVTAKDRRETATVMFIKKGRAERAVVLSVQEDGLWINVTG